MDVNEVGFNPETSTLSNGDYNYLQGWFWAAERKGLYDVDEGRRRWKVPMAIANTSQSDSYWNSIPTTYFPTSMPRAIHFDMVRDRQITLMETWLQQGVPHPDAPELSDLCKEHFPFDHLVGLRSGLNGLSLQEQKLLIGNSRHVAAVGAWFMYQISSAERSF